MPGAILYTHLDTDDENDRFESVILEGWKGASTLESESYEA